MASAGPSYQINGERHHMHLLALGLGLLIVAGLTALLLLVRGLQRQMGSLRAEIAAARIAGVLDRDDPVP